MSHSVTNPTVTNLTVTNQTGTNQAVTNQTVTNPTVTNQAVTNQTGTNQSGTNQSGTKPIEVLQVNESVVSCDGGGGRLGHPKVYLHMQGPLGTVARQVVCPYCSRLYLMTGDPVSEGH